MTLPPLANLFAVHDEDSAALDAVAADLATSGEYAEVWHPAPGWVAATAPLSGDFGFVRFRPDGAATVVRSAGGLVPFYLSRAGSRVAIGTRLGDFVRF